MQAKRGTTARKRKTNRPSTRITTKQRQQRRKNIRRTGIAAALLSICLTCLYVLNLDQFRINTFTIEGNKLLPTETIASDLQKYYSGKHYGLFPKDSIFWYGKKETKNYLKNKYTEINTVEVDLKKFDNLTIVIDERKQTYFAMVNGQLHDVDSEGTIFRTSDPDTESERVYYLGQDSGSKIIGDTLVDTQYFIEFNKFLNSLRQKGVVVTRVLFENKILTILELSNGSRLVLHPADAFSTTLQTLDEILLYKEFSYNRKQERFDSSVEYINLRYGSKLFYCYSGDACQDNYIIK